MSLLWKIAIAEYVIVALLLALTWNARRRRSARTNNTPAKSRFVPTPTVVFLLSLVLSACFTYVRSPVPKVHDEFSYLLSADTFAAGRLTNPTHPHWRHFESIHVLSRPTYSSKYPVGQGLFLALGQGLTGYPIVGVWLSTAAAAAALQWMCQVWFSRKWAALTGWIFIFHPTLHLLWGVTFMGGAVATIGSALLYGAWGGLRRGNGEVRYAALGAVGLTLLANSRPFEGLLVAMPIALAVVSALLQPGSRLRSAVSFSAVAAFMGILTFSTAAMLLHNRAVTGDPLELPYQRHSKDNMAGPIFLWQAPPQTPTYRNRELESFHTKWELDSYRALQGPWSDVLRIKTQSLTRAFHFASRPTLLLLALFSLSWRPNPFWILWLALLLVTAGLCSTVWIYPQYLGPVLPPLILLTIQGLRRVRVLRGRRGGWGRRAAAGIVTAYFVCLLIPFASFFLNRDQGWHRGRAGIRAELMTLPGNDLVIVRYAPHHISHSEWVYNQANIDASPVVWARDFGELENRPLLEYFSDRKVWLLEADLSPPELLEYDKVVAPTRRRTSKAGVR